MNYDTFATKWVGKRVDIDKAYGFQCVDLVKQYMLELYGIPNGAFGNAINYWTNPHPKVLAKFTKIATKTPQKGDVVILSSSSVYGHIGIATGYNTLITAEILEQNGGSGTGNGIGSDAIRKRSILKTRIQGVLRPNVSIPLQPKPQGKTLYLKPVTSSYAFYRPNTPLPVKRANRAGELNPAKWGGLSYPILRQVDANTYEVKSPSLGVIWIWAGDSASEIR